LCTRPSGFLQHLVHASHIVGANQFEAGYVDAQHQCTIGAHALQHHSLPAGSCEYLPTQARDKFVFFGNSNDFRWGYAFLGRGAPTQQGFETYDGSTGVDGDDRLEGDVQSVVFDGFDQFCCKQGLV
jgi:hypothetical protein